MSKVNWMIIAWYSYKVSQMFQLMQILRMHAHTCGSEYDDKKDNDKILNEAFGHSAVLYFNPLNPELNPIC